MGESERFVIGGLREDRYSTRNGNFSLSLSFDGYRRKWLMLVGR